MIKDGKVVWDAFFGTNSGGAYLRTLERQFPGIHITNSIPRRTITLFGSKERRESVRRVLLEDVQKLQQNKPRLIPVSPNAMGVFMSAELRKLQSDFGLENVAFSFLNRTVIVRGSDDVFNQAQRIVESAKDCSTSSLNAAKCPICLHSPQLPRELPCGHLWCQSCLIRCLLAAVDSRSFPLTCLGEGCTQLLPVSIARDVLNATQFDALVEAAFIAHIHSHPHDFFYCPTPNCLQICPTAPPDTILQCPSCITRICPKCHAELHDGLPCESSDDELFQRWADDNGVKSCPGCWASIERSEGCNHVACTQCQTHFCWVCMNIFPEGKGIYDHMREAHGGIGITI
jgi:hypothetical protein